MNTLVKCNNTTNWERACFSQHGVSLIAFTLLRYALRRIDGVRVTESKAMSKVDAWRKVVHPNVVAIKEAFSKTFASTQKAGTVFVHDYHPLAQTLAQRHLTGRPTHVSEPLLWS
jgi:hypothetical protein